MQEIFSLGELYCSDFLKPDEQPRSQKSELKLCMTDDGNVRLEKLAPLDTMFGAYWYRSGINLTMRNELKDIVNSILKIKPLKENDLWIDIGSNDGTLLSYIPTNLVRVGMDPADDSFKSEASKYANLIIQNYFSAETFQQSKFGNLKAKVITSIAMFYDLDKPENFIQDINKVLDDDGVWVMQLSYSPLMLEQLEFGNICHEHVYYYSLFNLKTLLEKNGFKIMDCQLNDINGGSFRIYIMKENANVNKFSSQPYRDVCNFRIKSLLEYEKTLKLDSIDTWKNFYNKILNLKEQTISFLKQEKAKGKKIWGYGASTKNNILMQFFGIDTSLIEAFAERSQYKWGTRCVGTNIPIFSEDEMRKAKPDYLFVGPWHFINEFIDRERDFLKGGGKFIVPCPKFEVIGL